MRGMTANGATSRFALVFTVILLSPKFAHAQSKQEIRIQAGGELAGYGSTGGIGFYGGVAYAPIHMLSFGVVGAYAVTDVECDSGYGDGCTLFASAFRFDGEVEFDPFKHHRVDPFVAADFGTVGLYHDGTTWGPSAGGTTGLHVFPIEFFSIDAGLRVFWVAANDDPYLFVGLFLGVTPRVSF
jgi:hypothetical protein